MPYSPPGCLLVPPTWSDDDANFSFDRPSQKSRIEMKKDSHGSRGAGGGSDRDVSHNQLLFGHEESEAIVVAAAAAAKAHRAGGGKRTRHGGGDDGWGDGSGCVSAGLHDQRRQRHESELRGGGSNGAEFGRGGGGVSRTADISREVVVNWHHAAPQGHDWDAELYRQGEREGRDRWYRGAGGAEERQGGGRASGGVACDRDWEGSQGERVAPRVKEREVELERGREGERGRKGERDREGEGGREGKRERDRYRDDDPQLVSDRQKRERDLAGRSKGEQRLVSKGCDWERDDRDSLRSGCWHGEEGKKRDTWDSRHRDRDRQGGGCKGSNRGNWDGDKDGERSHDRERHRDRH